MSSVYARMDEGLDAIVDTLDIPRSYYELAKQRAQSLEEWFLRDSSAIARFSPDVYPQGSFRYGTVIRPIFADDYYDLDLVCSLDLSKSNVSQKKLKELVGDEVRAYAKAHSFNKPASEKPRCWRLDYADDVSFHMDILPAIPESDDVINALRYAGVPDVFAQVAVAITDKRHAKFAEVSVEWPTSNPRGIARWFEAKASLSAKTRIRELVENRVYASVNEVPPYEWKTTLQRSIQILKRHRDVMFKDDREYAPISMIITKLSAEAYAGEPSLYAALRTILEQMPKLVKPGRPRVPNPVNPGEDFADRWSSEPLCEENFWQWHEQAAADLSLLASEVGTKNFTESVEERFDVSLRDHAHLNRPVPGETPVVRAAPVVVSVPSAPKPWRE